MQPRQAVIQTSPPSSLLGVEPERHHREYSNSALAAEIGTHRALPVATNVDSCFFGAQAALPYLKESRGSIVQIASASGLGGDRRLTAYNAAKGAVVNFTRGLAFDLGEFGIRVNTVAPSLTGPEELATKYADMVARFNQRRALAGLSTPADVAAAVSFLASDDARFITGAILPVDGGITAGSGQPSL